MADHKREFHTKKRYILQSDDSAGNHVHGTFDNPGEVKQAAEGLAVEGLYYTDVTALVPGKGDDVEHEDKDDDEGRHAGLRGKK